MSRLVVAVAVLTLAAAPPARAESPRWGSLDLGANNYRPDLDSEFPTSPGPWQEIFGTSRGWMFTLGISRSIFTTAGSLDVGLRSGYFQKSGKGLREDTLSPSGDSTTLKIIPTSLTLTYRFDLLADRWNIPFAPYARAALERYNWWVTDGSGKSVKEGATNGWSVTGGLAFLLDFVDPTLARELDRDSGVNHTYLYFEATKSKVDDFGSSSSWNLSDDRLSLGAGLLFVF